MGVIAFFLLVTSPLWMTYIVVAITGTSAREPALWMAIVTVITSWILVEDLTSGAGFGMSRVFYTAPGAIALLMAGMALHITWKDAKRGPKPDDERKDDAA